MGSNPYNSPTISGKYSTRASDDSSVGATFPVAAKVLLSVIGIALFTINPWRDLWFYKQIAAHEGFGTTADSYIIGFAGQLLATIVLFPVAVFLIVFGIGRSRRFSLRPRFSLFTWGWGSIASIASLLMLLIESDYVVYGLQHPHHLGTVLISLSYIAFIYVWWCCSLAHGRPCSPRSCPAAGVVANS